MGGRICILLLAAMAAYPSPASAQNWSFDARTIAMGGIGDSTNLATGMIAVPRGYSPIVLPFGLLQLLANKKIFSPDSADYDPVRSVEYAASPLY